MIWEAQTLPLIGLDDDEPRVRSTDPITSHIAADLTSSKQKRDDAKTAVWRILEDSNHPLTRDEIVIKATGEYGFNCTPQRLRTAAAELIRAKVIRKSDDIGVSQHGNPAELLELVPHES